MASQTKYSYKEIGAIASPILVSLLMEQLIGMTDTAFLGRIGETELAASALAGVYYLAAFMIALGFSVGAQILIGRRNGAGEYRKIGPIFYQGLYFLLAFAVLLFFGSLFVVAPLLKNVVSSPQVYEAAVEYLNWRIFGFFFAFGATMFRAFFVGTTLTRTLTLNSIVMVLSNVVFNYILIFGKLGFPALGIAGAAIGSSLAEAVSLLFFIVYTRRKVDLRKYGLERIPPVRFSLLKEILQLSFWTMLQNFISITVWFFFFLSVEHMGERPLAITNIVRSISAFPFMVVVAFASTGSSLVSNLIGAGEAQYVTGTLKQLIRMTYAIVLPILALFVLFPSTILRIYTDSPDLVAAAVPSLLVLCSSYLLAIPGGICFQAVSGTGNTRSALGIELATLAVYLVYLYVIIFRLHVDVALCWTTEHVYFIVTLLLSARYLKRGDWQKKRI